MTKVWIVAEIDYEVYDIKGICSTEERANRLKAGRDGHLIEERELDEHFEDDHLWFTAEFSEDGSLLYKIEPGKAEPEAYHFVDPETGEILTQIWRDWTLIFKAHDIKAAEEYAWELMHRWKAEGKIP